MIFYGHGTSHNKKLLNTRHCFADVNDCSLAEIKNETLCGENEKCVNRIGTYECPCCAGFERDSNGNCVGKFANN